MVREILTISIGQGGIQLGNATWMQYFCEHKILPDGSRAETADLEDESFLSFFDMTPDGQFVPTFLGVDTEPSVLDEVRRGDFSGVYHPDHLLNFVEDAANNFARGKYNLGKKLIDKVDDQIRKIVDACENVQGFIVNHAVGGGTGSGLGALILSGLKADYQKKSRVGFEIYPSPDISSCIVEPYNGLFATHWLLDHTDVSLVLDNEGLYEICQRKLNMKKPSFSNLNRIIAKVVSAMTCQLRFNESELNFDMRQYETNLVPFPRLHFLTTSISPIVPLNEIVKEAHDCRTITDHCFESSSFLVKYPNFNPDTDKYMAISLQYRGSISSKVAHSAVRWIKNQGKVHFVDWCPTGFKISINNNPPATVPDDDIAHSQRTAVMIGNNIAVRSVFSDRLSTKFDKMFAQMAYVHWYTGEGMESSEFEEARQEIDYLERDYQDVLQDQGSEEEPEEDYQLRTMTDHLRRIFKCEPLHLKFP